MSSFCIGSISWCCLAVLLFCCSSHVPLFRGIPIIPPAFRCSVSVPVFRRCSASVPCSGVPGFIVCHKKTRAEHTTMLNITQISITFLRSICPMQTWFSYAKRQKHSHARFWLKSGRKETIKAKNKEKENRSFLFYSQEASCLKNYHLKGKPQLGKPQFLL